MPAPPPFLHSLRPARCLPPLLFLAALTSGACVKQAGLYRSEWRLELGQARARAAGGAPDALAASGPCQPTAGGPHWIEEGDAFAVDVRCATGAGGGGLVVDPVPPGAAFDPAAGQLRWTPAGDQAGVWRLRVAAPGSGEESFVQIGVADRFDQAGNPSLASPEGHPAESGLPVMHLEIPDSINRERYVPSKVHYRGHAYRAEIKLRGRSSLDYPKKNYTLKFKRGDLFNEPDLGGGFLGRRRIVLITTFDDSSHLRHRLAFEVWNRLAPMVPIQHFTVVVYLNGQYAGLYVLADHVDEDLMALRGLSDRGNLYKVVDHAGNFTTVDVPLEALEKKNGKPDPGEPGSHDDIRGLLDFVVNADEERFRAELGGRIEIADYRAWMIAVLTMQATDSYGKNAFHYRDPASGPFRVVPWDFNASFGQGWETTRDPPGAEPGEQVGANRLFKRLWEDPVLGPQTREGWKGALGGPIAIETMLEVLDRLATEIAPAARRDERRWRAEHLAFPRWSARTDFTDFDAEVAYIRDWMRKRWEFLAGRL